MANFCSYCGTAITTQGDYCSNCGAKIVGSKVEEKKENNEEYSFHGTGEESQKVGSKSRWAAGILGVLLGGLGVHNFYLGYYGRGVAQLLLTLFSFGIGSIWGFIEGILILCGVIHTDSDGNELADSF